MRLLLGKWQTKRERLLSNLVQKATSDGGSLDGPFSCIEQAFNSILTDSSLLLIPGYQKTGTIYSTIPEVGGNLPTDRNSVAYRTAMSGLLESMAADVPRLDFSKGACPSWLIQGQGTNLFRDSEPSTDPGQGTRTNVTFAANDWASLIAESGLLAGKVVLNTLGGTQNCVYTNVGSSISNGIPNVISTFIKMPDSSTPIIRNEVANAVDADFAFVFAGNATQDIPVILGNTKINLGNNIWFVATKFQRTSANTNANWGLQKVSTYSLKTIEVSGICVFSGSNFDAVISDYIKTTGSATTRLADNFTDSLASAYIGQTEGAVAGRFYVDNAFHGRVITLHDGTEDELIDIYMSGLALNAELFAGGISQGAVASSNLLVGWHGYCLTWGNGVIQLWVDGVLVNESVLSGTATLTQYSLGSLLGTSSHYNGNVGLHALYLGIPSAEQSATLSDL
jgi:hypothetical protein